MKPDLGSPSEASSPAFGTDGKTSLKSPITFVHVSSVQTKRSISEYRTSASVVRHWKN